MAGSEVVGAGSLEDAQAFFPPSFSFSLGIALAEGSEIEEDVLERVVVFFFFAFWVPVCWLTMAGDKRNKDCSAK